MPAIFFLTIDTALSTDDPLCLEDIFQIHYNNDSS